MAGVRNSAQSHPPDRGGSDVPQSRSACRCTLARESLPPTTIRCRLVSTPVEAHRYSAFKALLDRAVLSSLLQDFACFVFDMRWELDPNLEQGDFPRGFRGHDLLNPGCASLEIPTMTIRNDPHIVRMQVFSAVAMRSVGEKRSPFPWLSRGASVSRIEPD